MTEARGLDTKVPCAVLDFLGGKRDRGSGVSKFLIWVHLNDLGKRVGVHCGSRHQFLYGRRDISVPFTSEPLRWLGSPGIIQTFLHAAFLISKTHPVTLVMKAPRRCV